jgi:hypothetical protein
VWERLPSLDNRDSEVPPTFCPGSQRRSHCSPKLFLPPAGRFARAPPLGGALQKRPKEQSATESWGACPEHRDKDHRTCSSDTQSRVTLPRVIALITQKFSLSEDGFLRSPLLQQWEYKTMPTHILSPFRGLSRNSRTFSEFR